MANTYSNVGGTGSGEANTASSVGQDPDKEIVAGKVGVDLKFKRLSAGANITLDDTTDPNAIKISTPGGAANAFSTIATDNGSSPVAQSETDTLTLKSTDGSVIITGDETDDSVNFQVVSAPQAAGYSSILTDFGTATAAGPAETVNFTSSDGSVTIIAGDGSGFPDIVDFSASGGLGIKFSSEQINESTIDGDVIIQGNCTIGNFVSTLTINGNLFFITSAGSLSSQGRFVNVIVEGSVYGPEDGLPATLNLASTTTNSSGAFVCSGSVYNTTVNTSSAARSGGDVTIGGSFVGPEADIFTAGPQSSTLFSTLSPGNVVVEGDCTARIVSCRGTDSPSPSSGATVSIGGDLLITTNGLWCYGGSHTASGPGASGGSLTVKGNLTSLSPTNSMIRLFGGSGSTEGGLGGSIVVYGDTFVETSIQLFGGGGGVSGIGGNGATGTDSVVFYGNLKAQTLDISGGDAGSGNGGNAVAYPVFRNGVNIGVLNASGGNASGGVNGGSFNFPLFEGGGFIDTVDMKEGLNGTESSVLSRLYLTDGHYSIGVIQATNKSGVKQRISGENSVLAIRELSGVTELTNGDASNTLATTPTELLESLYKFGDFNDDVKKVSGALDIPSLPIQNSITIGDHSIATYNSLFGEHNRVPLIGLFNSTPIERLQNVTDVQASEGEVLTYTGGSWTAQAPAAGGGGVTVIADAGTIGGSYDGDVIVEGNATVNADIVIRGSLYFTKTATVTVLNAQNTNHSLEVFGDVIATSDNVNKAQLNFRNDTGLLPASVKIHGDCIYCEVFTQSEGATGLSGGSIYVGGDFLGGEIKTHGGSSPFNETFAAGNGGDIFIGGAATVGLVRCYGGNSFGASGAGGAGANFTVGGNLRAPSSTFELRGGNSASATEAGGQGGNLTVEGNFLYENIGTVSLRGGSNFNFNGGAGGDITVKGNTYLTNPSGSPTIDVSGNTGAVGGNAGNLTFLGLVKCVGTIRADGGFGITGNGGNAPSSPKFLGGVDIQSLDMNGGEIDGGSSGTAGLAPTEGLISGGGFIRNLRISEGVGTSSGTAQKTSLTSGSYVIHTVTRKGNGTGNLQLRNCTLKVEALSNNSTLTNSTGNGVPKTVTAPEQKFYTADELDIRELDLGSMSIL